VKRHRAVVWGALTSDVTVTAADASGAKGSVSFKIVVVPDRPGRERGGGGAGRDLRLHHQHGGRHVLPLPAPRRPSRIGGGHDVRRADTPVAINACTPTPSTGSNPIFYLNADWATRPNGEIVNTDANLCLADRGSSTAKGSKLYLEPCDGDAGEIWGVG
jgi:hypothetical protein